MANNQRIIEELIRIGIDRQAIAEARQNFKQVQNDLLAISSVSQDVTRAEETRAQQTERLRAVIAKRTASHAEAVQQELDGIAAINKAEQARAEAEQEIAGRA